MSGVIALAACQCHPRHGGVDHARHQQELHPVQAGGGAPANLCRRRHRAGHLSSEDRRSYQARGVGRGAASSGGSWAHVSGGGFLVRALVLVGAPGPFFRRPGRGVDQPPSGVGGGGQRATHAAVPPAVRRWPLPLAGPRGGVFFQGGALRDKRLDRVGGVRRSWARKTQEGHPAPPFYELQHHVSWA
jgi:hypothetical protein